MFVRGNTARWYKKGSSQAVEHRRSVSGLTRFCVHLSIAQKSHSLALDTQRYHRIHKRTHIWNWPWEQRSDFYVSLENFHRWQQNILQEQTSSTKLLQLQCMRVLKGENQDWEFMEQNSTWSKLLTFLLLQCKFLQKCNYKFLDSFLNVY